MTQECLISGSEAVLMMSGAGHVMCVGILCHLSQQYQVTHGGKGLFKGYVCFWFIADSFIRAYLILSELYQICIIKYRLVFCKSGLQGNRCPNQHRGKE